MPEEEIKKRQKIAKNNVEENINKFKKANQLRYFSKIKYIIGGIIWLPFIIPKIIKLEYIKLEYLNTYTENENNF